MNHLRKDIQALRAIAVLSVVIFHFWPKYLPGGFIGVDVFFVISGFLITQHLLRDVASGTFSVTKFWARRIRRLLPASLLVLAATAVGIVTLAPESSWPGWLREVGASAGYFENWALAANSVDYLAADYSASPTQHFWSLSVEEQFYFALPLVILAALFVWRSKLEARITVTIAVIVLASFIASVWLTYSEPTSSYFFTQVRAWQFGAGALLAGVGASLGARFEKYRKHQTLLFVFGLVGIAASALLLSGNLNYPGWWALLPTVSAVLMIHAQLETGLIAKFFSIKPIQFIGDISYSIYLWHWPLLILAPLVIGNLSFVEKVAIIALTILLAWASRKYVELPFMSAGRRFADWRTFASMTAAVALLLGASVSAASFAESDIRTQLLARLTVPSEPCFGAAANLVASCSTVEPSAKLNPSADLAPADKASLLVPSSCAITNRADDQAIACNLAGNNAPVKIALVGDSHAGQYSATLLVLAIENGWQVDSYTKGACPFSYAERKQDSVITKACRAWVQNVKAKLSAYDLVITSQKSGVVWSDPTRNSVVAGTAKLWSELNAAGVPVLAIIDNPRASGATLACIGKAKAHDYSACSLNENRALKFDPQVAATKLTNSEVTQFIDFTNAYCANGKCQAVIGGAIVNRDDNHLTNTFAASLAPFLGTKVKAMIK